MSFRQTAAMLAATIALAVPASAQIAQTTVQLDGKDYTVTEMRSGRSQQHMVQLSGSDGTAMVTVDSSNKIVAYLSPPGGGAYKPLIDRVWAAYLETKGAAAPAAPAPDPNAALRQQAAAITAQAQSRSNGPNATSDLSLGGASSGAVVKTFTSDGVVVHDPNLEGGVDVTIANDGASASFIVQPRAGMMGTPTKMTAEYEGSGEAPSDGEKAGKFAKGAGTAVAEALNPRVVSRVGMHGNDVWRVKSQGVNGKATLYESGSYSIGAMPSMGRDAGQTVGLTILERIKQDIALATTEAASRKSRGETIAFDTSGARGQAAQASLAEATKAFDLK